MTKTVAKELGSRGITCNAVAPGFIKTPMTDKLTDEYLGELEKRIAKLYSKASKKAVKKVENYLEQFEEEDAEKRQEYESGEISKDEYSKWRRNLMIVGAFYVLRNELTNDLTNVDVKAMQFAASTMLDVYALNVNYEMYCIEHDLMVDLGYSLYNRKAVERLINENPKLLPRPKVNIPKDIKWNRTHIQTAITQGIIQGDSIPDIAKRLERVVVMQFVEHHIQLKANLVLTKIQLLQLIIKTLWRRD
jgi:hypothetical protein